MVNTLLHLLLIQHLCRGHVVAQQLVAVFAQALKLNAFRMSQKQQIDRFVDRLKLQFPVAIVHQQEPVVFRDAQAAQPALGSLQPQIFHDAHPYGLQ